MMRYKYVCHQDIGMRPVNQDSAIALEAETDDGPVMLLSVCDGMGGLSHGEVASSKMVGRLSEWFGEELPDIIQESRNERDLEKEIFAGMKTASRRADKEIRAFSNSNGIRCGTTSVALLLFKNKYYVMNIGDSRAYLYRKRLHQLTKDQTKAQRMIDNNELSEEEARTHKASSVLLQCVGTGSLPEPEFCSGTVLADDIFLLCSDGFRHKVTKEDMENAFSEENPKTTVELMNTVAYLTEENKKRGEHDNITACVARVFQ